MKPKDKKDDKNKQIPISIKQEPKNKYNESYENTLDNIHAIAVFGVKIFGRLGYLIKLMEEIKTELIKQNKRK